MQIPKVAVPDGLAVRLIHGIFGACAAIVLAASANHARAASIDEKHAEGHILVQPRAGLSDAEFDRALAPHGGRKLGKLPGLDVYVVTLPATASERAVANRLSHDPRLKFAEPDELVAPQMIANDTYFGNEWQLQAMQVPAAWDISRGQGIVVAVLDTGVDSTHPDLQGQLVAGWNFWDNNSNTADVYGHGTLVAGTIAAMSNNGTGVASVAWNAKVMPLRISDVNGYGSWSAMASALTWAADHGARVANISYMVQNSATVQSAAQYFRNKGGVVVNSAGNTGTYDATAPSDSLLSVAATDAGDNRASWATYGSYVDLAAPGVAIWTTASGGGYAAVSGTSFSSPLTAGVAALMMAANPALSPAALVGILQSTAADLGTPGKDQYYGYGRVNAAAAVQAAAGARTTDTQAPSVAVTSPSGGTMKGLVAVNVAASDNVGVARVELLVNGVSVGSDASAPYAFSWNSTQFADGGASIVARAFDAAGNSATSSAVAVTIANAATTTDVTPPTVKISNPANGARVSGQVTISAQAADNVGIGTVSLYIDGAMKSTGNAGSTSYRWNTNKVKSGTHTIAAVAKDKAGNQATTTIQVSK